MTLPGGPCGTFAGERWGSGVKVAFCEHPAGEWQARDRNPENLPLFVLLQTTLQCMGTGGDSATAAYLWSSVWHTVGA